MAENDKVFRIVMKRGAGVPTIPVSADHRNGDWLPTDIYEGETYQDTNTGLTYTRDGSSIVKVDGTPTKKVYKALLTQTSTNAPLIVELENTLSGALVSSYVSTGRYDLTLAGAFPVDLTFILIGSSTTNARFIQANRQSDNAVRISTGDETNTVQNDVLTSTAILIEVYS